MKLVKIGRKAIMLQLVIDGKDTWVNTSNQVKEYVKKTYKEGDDIEVTFGNDSGDGLKYVTRVGNGENIQSNSSSNSDKGKCADCGAEIDKKYTKCFNCNKKNPEKLKTDEPKCEDCGKVLKDRKYKKCYDCNKKNPAPKATSTYTGKDNDLIKREAVAHATSRVMIGLQGQYDRNDVGDVFTAIYNIILKLVENR